MESKPVVGIIGFKNIGGCIFNSQLVHINKEKLFQIEELNLKNYPAYSFILKNSVKKAKSMLIMALFRYDKVKGIRYYLHNCRSICTVFSFRDLVYCIKKY